MTSSLSNRIALVTGASRGIGYAVALELARRGAHVIALARTQGALEELDDDIRKVGGDGEREAHKHARGVRFHGHVEIPAQLAECGHIRVGRLGLLGGIRNLVYVIRVIVATDVH